MNLVILPFHDLRKCRQEGFRTRDCHLTEHLIGHQSIDKILIVNRPITHIESVYKRKNWKTAGDVVKKGFRYRVTEVHPKCLVLDVLSYDMFTHILKGKAWFFKVYGSRLFYNYVQQTLREFGFHHYHCLNFTLYATGLIKKMNPINLIFDAWDNWLKIGSYQSMYSELYSSYKTMTELADVTTTNSDQNKAYFSDEFKLANCDVIKNGVDIEKFNRNYPIPEDLKQFKKPIIGIAAKITHLVDVELLNDIAEDSNVYSLVLIGQILDRRIFRRLSKKIHYLGDKHYTEYPRYVKHFDLCLIPYVVGEKEHGIDSIKVYEFLAAGKPVITTHFGGIDAFKDEVSIIKNRAEFRSAVKQVRIGEEKPIPEYILNTTWKKRTERFINLLQEK